MGDLAKEDPEILLVFLQMFNAKEDIKSIPHLFSLIYHYCWIFLIFYRWYL